MTRVIHGVFQNTNLVHINEGPSSQHHRSPGKSSALGPLPTQPLTGINMLITPHIRMLDSDWLIAVIFFYKFRPCIVNLQNFYFM